MIRIRSCQQMAELDACVQLQFDTWGYDATEAVPLKSFLLAQKIGGQVFGAFDGDDINDTMASRLNISSEGKLVGFAMSLPGVKTIPNGPEPYLHSHMLAVRSSHRDLGIGAQLKWEQRRDALGRGLHRIEWTFDPLEIKNAFLNIHRLGAVARAYRVDFYGVSSSRLQGGLPTDRLVAERDLNPSELRTALPAIRQPNARSRSAFRFRLRSVSGRQAKQPERRLSRFNWRIKRDFSRHFPAVWQCWISLATPKATVSMNWALTPRPRC
ncbi:MAG: GNAT family N-acetyltransferase [Terracidiphilus sp.]